LGAFVALSSGRDYYAIVMNKFLCFLLLIALAGLGMLVGSSCESLQQETEPEGEESSAVPVEGPVTISVVYDNYQVNSNLSPGWGFGCVIRTPTQDILFDTGGDSSILLSNMEKMNIDPKDIDIVVISHIHGDHVGGLDGFLDRNANVRVYIPASFPDSWRDKIESHGAEYRDVTGARQISDRVYTTGQMGTWIKEQSLVVDTNEGLVIISGCAHPGVLNIATKARQILPHREFYLFMGGFHLSGSSDSELRNIVQGFRDMGVQRVAPSHCSGDRCRELFKEEYKEDYIDSGVGRKIVL
jgi:7,8-dihydropterin-6-yl-methyl-4-(beta-D-ribofuranosyl)aminobenzene 5'-phosphate synthase